jgi:hypothetical protein
MGFLITPNADGECCADPCEQEDPCDPCDDCPCGDQPESVIIVEYGNQIVGEDKCQKEVFTVENCTKSYYQSCDTDTVEFGGGLVYMASPINRWMIGQAVSDTNGCSGLFGDYKVNDKLSYKVTTTFPRKTGETIIGDLTPDSTCEDCPPPCCDSGSGVSGSGVPPPPPPVCTSGIPDCCGSGLPPCSGDQPCCSSGIPSCSEVEDPCGTGSGVSGSGVNGSGTCDPCCDETNDCDPVPCCDSPDPCNPPNCCSEDDETCGGECEPMTFDDSLVPDSGCP